MATSYGNMTLRERVTEVDRKQRRSNRNEERSEDGFESPEETKPKRRDRRGGTKYDSQGIHKASHQDLCDCLTRDCPGCFMPCKKCSSNKCGHECRKNRRWEYENIQIEDKTSNSW
ncbi:unnamed protein product [Larinioides sclopetarius]|uniref:ARF7 effector protein C-terminal domain-containing protein n=1 Tax=Larinioides sclopetarius TaxID=280406 RepID=A0AAV1ZGC2_9ARAC